MDVGLLILRVVVGALFVAHGTQKLFGWFGGYGIDTTAGFMSSLRYRKPRLAALGAGAVEAGAGLLLASGFFTPLAAAGIIGVMINAIASAKWSQGLFGGYELDLAYLVSAVALAFTGGAAYSIDRALGWDLGGVVWGLGAIALGTLAAVFVLATRVAPAVVTEQVAEAVEGRRAA